MQKFSRQNRTFLNTDADNSTTKSYVRFFQFKHFYGKIVGSLPIEKFQPQNRTFLTVEKCLLQEMTFLTDADIFTTKSCARFYRSEHFFTAKSYFPYWYRNFHDKIVRSLPMQTFLWQNRTFFCRGRNVLFWPQWLMLKWTVSFKGRTEY